jgi:hypothetical protein
MLYDLFEQALGPTLNPLQLTPDEGVPIYCAWNIPDVTRTTCAMNWILAMVSFAPLCGMNISPPPYPLSPLRKSILTQTSAYCKQEKGVVIFPLDLLKSVPILDP